MSSDLMLDVGQANEFKLAARRANWTNDDIKWLCEGDNLEQIRNVRRGFSEIKPIEYVVDLDADPFIPAGCTVEEGKHQKGGSFKWDPKKVKFYLSKQQQKGSVKGELLRDALTGQPVFNANLLDFLLANKHLIPEEWKQDEQGRTRYICFWGTEYRYSDGDTFVRCLYWHDGDWRWNYDWLDYEFDVQSPAALRAS